MIEIQKFRNNLQDLKEKYKLRGIDEAIIDQIYFLDKENNSLIKEINELNSKKNLLNKSFRDKKEISIKEMSELKEKIKDLNNKHQNISENLNALLSCLPNITSDSLPLKNKLIYTKNDDIKKLFLEDLSFEKKSYIEICSKLSLILFEESINLSGYGFTIYQGYGDLLFKALINFTLEENSKKGYKRLNVPVIINSDCLYVTSQISKFSKDLFKIDGIEKYLSPTGETQLVNLYKNKIIEESKLPIKLTTNSNCFRNESIAHGSENKGIIRMYQFNKTEIVVFCKESESEFVLEQMSLDAEDLLNKLGLPYRKILLAHNDIGFSAHKTYDLEVWFPSENKYKEISSISNTLDFQSRRGKIKWKKNLLDQKESTKYLHILNGSSLAIDRLFAAIIENYQTKEGYVNIPKILQKYFDNKLTVIS